MHRQTNFSHNLLVIGYLQRLRLFLWDQATGLTIPGQVPRQPIPLRFRKSTPRFSHKTTAIVMLLTPAEKKPASIEIATMIQP
jgi:hypothetical protein